MYLLFLILHLKNPDKNPEAAYEPVFSSFACNGLEFDSADHKARLIIGYIFLILHQIVNVNVLHIQREILQYSWSSRVFLYFICMGQIGLSLYCIVILLKEELDIYICNFLVSSHSGLGRGIRPIFSLSAVFGNDFHCRKAYF